LLPAFILAALLLAGYCALYNINGFGPYDVSAAVTPFADPINFGAQLFGQGEVVFLYAPG
jgi:hypothetical protein